MFDLAPGPFGSKLKAYIATVATPNFLQYEVIRNLYLVTLVFTRIFKYNISIVRNYKLSNYLGGA